MENIIFIDSSSDEDMISELLGQCSEYWSHGSVVYLPEIKKGKIIATVFLINDEIVGFHLMKKGEGCKVCEWNDIENITIDEYVSEDNGNTYWGGLVLFVKEENRNNGIAKKIVKDTLLKYDIDIENYGFCNQFIEDGYSFAKQVFPKYRRII